MGLAGSYPAAVRRSADVGAYEILPDIAHRKMVQMHHRRGIQGQKGHGAHKGQADIPVPERMRGARLNGRDR